MFRRTAHVYDLIYEASGKDYAVEAAEIHALIQHRRPGARTLVDVACGTGGHLRHLRAWYDVSGTDVDPAMLAVAGHHLPDVDLVLADMRTLRLGVRFHVAVCLFSSIGYMRDVEELQTAVKGMAGLIDPGGLLIVDGWVRPDAWRDEGSTHVETAAREEVTVVRVGRTRRDANKTYLEMHHLIATADGIEHVVDHHELTLFSPDEYGSAFENAGLDVEVVGSPMEGRDRYIGTKKPSA